jgi:hypothetical protein
MKALTNVQLSAQNVGAASGTVAQISTEEQQEPRRSVRFADRTRSYSPFPRDSYSRNRELIIPRDQSYSPRRQRYESSDREQYRRPQSTDGRRDGSGDRDKTVHTVTVLTPMDQTNESVIEEEPIVALFLRD